ncbi:MAG: ABC transporter ATP-binding protein/permease [Oscillospiraceae bacterium]|nr:ABC transporter ATP-binding protein/permease [Oscillospiraceae bacterium]
MLELKNIKKDYPAGDGTVHALKGISLQFRENDFVSILGPSGCGKTTMLNIIGGLDQYTDGDLVINGRSTKNFKDRDWDAYRNYSVGFVFQSYNLIPHQTVLQNVEIALALSGVSKAERRKRAAEALERVGLGSQLKKRPSEMSGGQMQRVAIARALVNDPDIILADEPTGALDTETSVQVMDILKEISKDRLVVMVTHNPELAEKYSTRIIRMLDGEITSDTKPLTEQEAESEHTREKEKAEAAKSTKKPSMSFGTSFGLSLKNLFTKKGRTALTSFAGSIGIIGIALIYAVSNGMTDYIDNVQESTLSSYPLTIQSQTVDMTTMMQIFMDTAESGHPHENDAVYQKSMVHEMINALNNMETIENDLESFNKYIIAERDKETDGSALREAISGIQYTYDLDLLIYAEDDDGNIVRSDTQQLMQQLILDYMGMDLSFVVQMRDQMGSMSPMMTPGSAALWQEMLDGNNGEIINPLLEKQYDIIYGSWPAKYDEIVLVVDENNELDDMTLYAMGLKTGEEIGSLMDATLTGKELPSDTTSWSYQEICSREFKVILNSDCYAYDEATGTFVDLRDTDAGLRYLYDNALTLKVSGIIRPNEDAVATMLTGSIAYTSELTKYVIEHSKDSPAIEAQLEDPSTDVFTGLPFNENSGSLSDEEKEAEFREYISGLNETEKAQAYIKIMGIPTAEQLAASVEQTMGSMGRTDMENALVQALTQQAGINADDIMEYASSMSDEDLASLFTQMLTEQIKMQFAAQVQEQLGAMTSAQLAAALDMEIGSYTTERCAVYYDEVLEFSGSSYDNNLKIMGYVDLEKPASINFYASSFANKDVIEDAIADYNETVDELYQIQYTDYIGLMMSSVTTIINAITYVLIAFVAISLIVSSIMIGVITLISVQERTKEIGILRAIGASKANVSSMFNAETVIIGFTSGALGIIITYLLCIPINIIMHELTGINNLSAVLPVPVALILIAISVILTLFAGIIPSRSAAKKDPVVALRTE